MFTVLPVLVSCKSGGLVMGGAGVGVATVGGLGGIIAEARKPTGTRIDHTQTGVFIGVGLVMAIAGGVIAANAERDERIDDRRQRVRQEEIRRVLREEGKLGPTYQPRKATEPPPRPTETSSTSRPSRAPFAPE